jgi:hypothetical protein
VCARVCVCGGGGGGGAQRPLLLLLWLGVGAHQLRDAVVEVVLEARPRPLDALLKRVAPGWVGRQGRWHLGGFYGFIKI